MQHPITTQVAVLPLTSEQAPKSTELYPPRIKAKKVEARTCDVLTKAGFMAAQTSLARQLCPKSVHSITAAKFKLRHYQKWCPLFGIMLKSVFEQGAHVLRGDLARHADAHGGEFAGDKIDLAAVESHFR
jgi:hypothetical protein